MTNSARTTEIIATGEHDGDAFVALTDTGRVRLGYRGLSSVDSDIPAFRDVAERARRGLAGEALEAAVADALGERANAPDLVAVLRKMERVVAIATSYRMERRDAVALVAVLGECREVLASHAPSHTDLMVSPESLDGWLSENPPSPPEDHNP